MDKDRVEGAAHQVKGAVKEAVGKVTGDAKTQAEGPRRRRPAKYKTRLVVPKTPSAIPSRSDRDRHVIVSAAVFAYVRVRRP